MFLTDQTTAATTLPTPAAAGTPGYFTNGSPGTGVPATIVDADWLNMLQLELMSIVSAAAISPSKTTYTQVLAAIKRINQNTAVLADTGAVNAYTAVNATPLVSGTWIDGVVQAVKIAHTNTGASTYAPDGLTAIPIYGLGLQPLQGGELLLNGTAILMHATIAGVNSGNPIAVLMECAGGAQQVASATQSQHAMQLGQATGRLLRTTTFYRDGSTGTQMVSTDGGAPTSTGATTFTSLSLTNKIRVRVQGGGGGGGGTAATGASQYAVGAGGGAGGYAENVFASGFAGGIAISIGAKGAGATAGSNNGGTGGSSSFGSLITATGGAGGAGGTVQTGVIVGVGGNGGTSTGGQGNGLPCTGSVGLLAVGVNTGDFVSGSGAATPFGGGGAGWGSAASVGNIATSWGAGGGGAAATPSISALTGGNGAPGIIIIDEYQ